MTGYKKLCSAQPQQRWAKTSRIVNLIFAYQSWDKRIVDWSFCFDHSTIWFLSGALIEVYSMYTCVDSSGVVSRIIGTKSPPWKFLLDWIYTFRFVIDQVVATHGWIGVGSTYQKLLFSLLTFQLDQHPNVILAVILKSITKLVNCLCILKLTI